MLALASSVTSCLLATFNELHAGSFFVICSHSVHCSLCCQHVVHGFDERYGRVFQFTTTRRMTSSICNVILMRMISFFGNNTRFRFESFYLPFAFCQRGSPFAQCHGPPRLLFDTATFFVGALAVGMRSCFTHVIAGSVGISSFCFLRFEHWRRNHFFGRNMLNFSSFPLLLQLLLGALGHRRPYFWPDRFWS